MNEICEYITTEGTLITAHLCGPLPEGATKVCDGFQGRAGDDTRWFDPQTWLPIPLATLVSQDLIPAPWGFELVNGDLVEMTLGQKISSGLIAVPSGQVYDSTLGAVRPMTPQELGRAGLIALPVLQSQLCAMVDSWQPILQAKGFKTSGMSQNNGTFSAAADLQALATGVLSAVTAGLAITWPMPWPNSLDEPTSIVSTDDFKVFSTQMFDFVFQVAQNIGAIKASIRAATDTTTAANLYDTWESQQSA